MTDANEIYEQFRGMIVSGQVGSGERLPTVRQVASDLGVANGTAAKAYKMLEADGLVYSRTGAGTRVSEGASVLPGAIVSRIRELVFEAKGHEVREEDVVTAIRSAWSS
ncbi:MULTISPECIES: GntR family transcriptional regulator [unclassified Salinibacterium]|uniref:GntR family transcriptional regulator n=1 Tax=unclassified Salinibacterium TaxID=2632331 RepID=UPI0027D9E657|nr:MULTISPECIES: GntR family transcriptional regulator [unclassified Salinibacterium]